MQPLLQWKTSKNYLSSARVCRLRNPALSAHASNYIVMCVPSGCKAFFHTRLSEEKIHYSQNFFLFSLQRLSKAFLSLRITKRGIITNAERMSCRVLITCVRF